MLKIHVSLTNEDIDRAKTLNHEDPNVLFSSGHRMVDTLFVLLARTVTPVITAHPPQPDTREHVILGFYWRTVALLDAVTLLRESRYIQTINATARTLVEILLNVALLDSEQIENDLERFALFIGCQRLAAAERMVEFQRRYPHAKTRRTGDAHREFIGSHGARIRTDAARLWPPKRGKKPQLPAHWSGHGLETIAAMLGSEYLSLWHEWNDYRNWHSHASQAGVLGFTPENLIALAGFGMRSCFDAGRRIGAIMARRIGIPVSAEFDSRIERLETVLFIDELLKRQGEPQRVNVVISAP